MKKLLLPVFLLIIFHSAMAQTIRYVKTNGNGDGSTWANAASDLQLMINSSVANDEVWVAGGTYIPNRRADALGTTTPTDRNNAFVLKADVKIYGGFAGTELNLNTRDLTITANKSTLSGDIGTVNNTTDNAYHVCVSAGAVGTAELNGFTISGGNANGTAGNILVNSQRIYLNNGGGMNNRSSSPALTNITLTGNYGIYGGGLYNENSASPVLTNVSLLGNNANSGGGMYDANLSSPKLTNVVISNNTISANGGGIYNASSSPILNNVTISGNGGGIYGGGIYNFASSSPVLNNVSISGNSAYAGGGMHNSASYPALNNVIINGNTASNYGGGMSNTVHSSPVLNNVTIIGNSTGGIGTELWQDDVSVTVNNSIILGSNANAVVGTVNATNSMVSGITTGIGNINPSGYTVAQIFSSPTGGNYTLKAGSPAINAGNNSFVTTSTDFAGNARIRNSEVDLGAYEVQTGNTISVLVPTNDIIYVKKGITTGTFTGSSWANAIGELADALLAAKNNTAIKQIWAAGGTYKPLYSPEDGANFGTNQTKDNAFLLVNNVQVYGGFAGTETALTDRILTLTANKSTLSGDLNSDDGANFANNGENTYHVVISVNANNTTELNGFTISNGNTNSSNANGITVNTKTISRTSGSGMYNNSSSPKLTNVTISGNVAYNYGGGMYNVESSSPNLTNVTISGNTGFNGAGMVNDHSSAILTNVIISGNNGTYGGGMNNESSSPVLTNVTISGNSARNGGGILNQSSSPVLINVAISGNVGSSVGGGVYNEASSPVLTNVALLGNTAGYGGGLYNQSSSFPVLTNVTISGNTATNGGGMYNWNNSSPKINNSIIYNNNSGIENSGSGISVPVYQYSLVQGINLAGTISYTGATDGTGIFANPLAPGLSTGGDYTLKSGSPAINAGNNTFFTAGQTPDLSAITTDILGNLRKQNGAVDLGAYESPYMSVLSAANGIVYVKQGATGNGSSWVNAAPELADALLFAKINNAVTTNLQVKQIWVAGGIYKPMYSPEDGVNFGTDKSRDNAFLLVKDVKIFGGFAGTEVLLTDRILNLAANKSTLSGDFLGDDVVGGSGSTLSIAQNDENACHVVVSTDAVGTAELNGFTISGGNSNKYTSLTVNSQKIVVNSGGGMINYSSSPALTNVIIIGNTASNVGGGMYNNSSSPALNNVTISNNKGYGGAGIYSEYSSSPVLTNVIINGNLGTNGNGGGMSSYSSSSPKLTNVNISGNRAAYGGGIYSESSSLVLTNAIITGNSAEWGGGMCNASQGSGLAPVLTNVTISGNTASANNGGGGIYNSWSTSPIINNSIIYNNNTAVVNYDLMPVYKHSLVQDNPAGTGMVNYTGAVGTIFVNPLPPGLSTAGDYNLKSGSPAINAGNDTFYAVGQTPDLSAITTDLAGNLRIQKGLIDLGAYESPYLTVSLNANGIVFVKKGATGNGSSWANALGELADALVFAKTNNAITTNAQVTQIWVAGGTYKPLYSPEDGVNFGTDQGRDNTFLLVKDVKIYGGFTATETTLNQRDLSMIANKSTLSGDFNDDDGINFANNGENACHIVVAIEAVGTAEINGFTISGGNANQTGTSGIIINGLAIYPPSGGGMYHANSSPLLTNLKISNNSAAESGSGLSNFTSSPILNNVTIGSNNFTIRGGGMYSSASFPVLTNVTINGNAAEYGGGIANSSSNSVFTNTLITGNTATNAGGGIFNSSSVSMVLTNVTISGNTAVQYGGGIANPGSAATINNSIIYNNITPNLGGTIVYTNSLVQDNPTGTINYTGAADGTGIFVSPLTPGLSMLGNYTLKAGSPAINAGNNTFYAVGQTPDLSAITADLAGNPRFKGAAVDLGAYELQSQSQTISPITTITKTYGDIAFEPGATATSGLSVAYLSADNSIAEAYQDVANGNKWKINIKKTGTVNITASQTGDGSFLPATAVVFSLVINKKPVTVTLATTSITKGYDANSNASIALANLGFAVGGVIGADQLTVSLSSTSAFYDDKNVGTGKAVSIPLGNISFSGTSAGNYRIANVADISANVGVITAKALTVKANNYNKIYDGAPYSGGNGVGYIGFALNDNQINSLAGLLEYAGTAQQAISAGVYAIEPKGYTAANYTINYVSGVLTIAPSTANVLSFNAQQKNGTLTKTYGDGSINASAIATSNLSTSYQSDNAAVAAVNPSGQVEIKGTGTAVITASQAGNTNYNPATAISFTVEVVKKTLDVRAKDDNKTFNSLAYAGGNGLIYNGFVYGENESKLGGTVTYSGTSQGAINTGTYLITPLGLTAANYNLNYLNGTLNIQPSGNNVVLFKSQTDGTNLNVTYGDGNIDASATATSGLLVNYLSSNSAVATVAADGTVTVRSAGTSTITASQQGDSNYQAAISVSFSLTVQKKALIITANNYNKVYDALAYTTGNDVSYTGFANGEGKQQLTGILSYVGTAINAKNVGSYFISPMGYSSGNYAITYQDGSLTITKAGLTVVADAKSKNYGDADPALTYTVTGLIGTDVLLGSLARTAGENVGAYAISQNTLSAGANYTISYTPANLNITKAVLTVTAENKQFCQGNGFPSLTMIYAGFKLSDNVNSLSTKPTVSTTANGKSAPGSYVLSSSGGVSANYSFIYVSGNLTIYAKPIPLITSSKNTQVSKGETLVLTASGGTTFLWSNADGIVSGQQTAVLTIRPTVTTTYMVTVGNANGCSETSSITIEVKDDFQAVKANNILTPNGDGINDVWVIENIDMYPNNVVTVFDRGGRIMFSQKGYKNTWDGTVKGLPLAENTYYYIIDFGTDKLKQKGFITLVRQQ